MGRKLLSVMFLMLSACVAAAFADSIATVVAVQGSPSASGPGGSRILSAKGAIFEHDKITVGSGNAQILFVDGTKLVVGPGSTLVVEKFLMRGGNSAQNFSINALRGTFRFITGNSPKSAYKIRTANATIGIRGTGFDFWVKSKTGVAVLEGKVKLCSTSSGKKSGCVDLEAGCDVGIAENGKSNRVKAFLKGPGIVSNLPYITNQSSLRPSFRLNTNSCKRSIQFVIPEPRSGERSGQQPPTRLCTGAACN